MKVSAKIYVYLWSIIILSEFLLLYDSHIFYMDWNLIRLPYVGMGVLLLFRRLSSNDFQIQRDNPTLAIELLWGFYIVLFGYVLVNPLMTGFTKSNTISQVVSFLITVVTAEVVRQYGLRDVFVKISFYTISLYMLFHFIAYISEINPATFIYVLSNTERSRSALGFGHPNSLGNICLCQIILFIFNHKINHRANIISKMLLFIGVVMLLCSASRNAIFGLVVFLITWLLLNIRKFGFSTRTIWVIKASSLLLIAVYIVSSFFESSESTFNTINQLVFESNRNWLFEVAIPAYIKSGRIWIGLGYVANYIYGTNLTPYYTLFMDNAYVYHLVSTGVIGISIIAMIILKIWKNIKTEQTDLRDILLSTFAAHMFLCLFENHLFSGIISCFVYMVLYLSINADFEERRSDGIES